MVRRQHRESRGTSQRQLRVSELIRHALAEMLTRGDVHDPILESHVITVPEVEARSGPTKEYLPTSKLKYGERVLVLRPSEKDPSWLAIRLW